jgi:hypothetical protein
MNLTLSKDEQNDSDSCRAGVSNGRGTNTVAGVSKSEKGKGNREYDKGKTMLDIAVSNF